MLNQNTLWQILGILLVCIFIGNCDVNRYKDHKKHDNISRLKRHIENFDEPLSYCQFIAMRDNGSITIKEAEQLIDYAYTHNNPILFKPAAENIASTQYSLNFLWLSAEIVDKRDLLTGSDKAQFERNLITPLLDWQKKIPQTMINYWYDGTMVKNESIQHSKDYLQYSGINTNFVRFRNIRDIKTIQNNAELFTTNIPIYFKIDLTKAVIADSILTIDKIPYVATIDNDVAAITKEQLFDQRTLDATIKYGYIFGTAFTQEENSFILLHNSLSFDIAAIHKKEVLDASISIAKDKLRSRQEIEPQLVYWRYAYFRSTVNKIRGREKKVMNISKNMIFPQSIHGGGGYSDSQITALKKALLGYEGCNK